MNSPMSHPAVSPAARIEALARDDKWFLGGLDGVVWAPPFPKWLHRPGFWDPAHVLQHEVGPGFSVALVRPDGQERRLRAAPGDPGGREPAPGRWRPGRLVVRWSDESGVIVEERRRVLPGGILESSWHVPAGIEGHLVGFTAQPADGTSEVERTEAGLGWTRTVSDRRGQELTLRMDLAGSVSPAWQGSVPSEGSGAPEWRHSPFADGGGAAPDPRTDPDARRYGRIWIGVALPLSGISDGGLLTFRLTLRLRNAEPDRAAPLTSPPASDTPAASAWESFFSGFPHFRCGDPYLDRYFDYRIYGPWPEPYRGSVGPGATPRHRRRARVLPRADRVQRAVSHDGDAVAEGRSRGVGLAP